MNYEYHIATPNQKLRDHLSDPAMMHNIFSAYCSRSYAEMKGLIMEYGEYLFFQDLKRFLEIGYWRNSINKYYIFCDITIKFFDIFP